MYSALIVLSLLSLLSVLPSSISHRPNYELTPLHLRNKTSACYAERLRSQNRYVCDNNGNIICMNGWTNVDQYCDTPVCYVNNRTCNHGRCILPNKCACEVGWDGQCCDVCIPLPGCQNGYCENPMECKCKPGWQGSFCAEVECPDACTHSHGHCHEPNVCSCHPGWKGENCTECITLPNCIHGKCVDHPFQCKCDPGYTGLGCSKPVCRAGCSKDHGHCKVPNTCLCELGWQGENCTECVVYPGCPGTCNKPYECTIDDTEIPCGDFYSFNGMTMTDFMTISTQTVNLFTAGLGLPSGTITVLHAGNNTYTVSNMTIGRGFSVDGEYWVMTRASSIKIWFSGNFGNYAVRFHLIINKLSSHVHTTLYECKISGSQFRKEFCTHALPEYVEKLSTFLVCEYNVAGGCVFNP